METILMTQVFGTLYGFLGVLFGAFGAHYLKSRLEPEDLQSFETGVRYQLIHALLLLILGFNLEYAHPLEIWASRSIILGILMFSFSIYGLVWSGYQGKKWRWLGPVTPLGGLLLLAGWALVGANFLRNLF